MCSLRFLCRNFDRLAQTPCCSLAFTQIRSLKRKQYEFSELDANDLIEKNVQGSGPGGQKVNTSHNAIYLKHTPTGLSVKVHKSREIDKNRIFAYEKLQELVDEHYNGEHSYLAQMRQQRQQRAKLNAERKERRKARLQLKLEHKRILELETNAAAEPDRTTESMGTDETLHSKVDDRRKHETT